jgi:hypothetical protein
MIFQRAYIISWLGDHKITLERLKNLEKTIAWCNKKNLKPCVIAMEWYDHFYSEFGDEVEFIKIPFQIPPGQARNIGINHFYSTDDDYCILLDDDSFIERGDSIIDWFQSADSESCKDLWVLSVPDQELEKSHYEPCKDAHILRPALQFTSGIFILKNVRKFTEIEELFFNPHFVIDEKGLLYGEDGNFLVRAQYKGLQTWQVHSSLANLGRDRTLLPSTWLTEKDIQDEITRRGNHPGKVIERKEFTESKNGVIMSPNGPMVISITNEYEKRLYK